MNGFLVFILCHLFYFPQQWPSESPVLVLPSNSRADSVRCPYLGEQWIYTIEYLNLPAAEIIFMVNEVRYFNGCSVYCLKVTARTNSVFSKLFKVNNIYQSLLLADGGYPLQLRKVIQQKNLHQEMVIEYDQQRHLATCNGQFTWEISDRSHNFFSTIYYLRGRPLLNGDTLMLNLDSESIPYEVKAEVLERSWIHLSKNKYQAIKVHLRFRPLHNISRSWKTDLLTNRLVHPDSELTVWFSDDIQRIPLMMSYHLSPFDVKVILNKCKDSN